MDTKYSILIHEHGCKSKKYNNEIPAPYPARTSDLRMTDIDDCNPTLYH